MSLSKTSARRKNLKLMPNSPSRTTARSRSLNLMFHRTTKVKRSAPPPPRLSGAWSRRNTITDLPTSPTKSSKLPKQTVLPSPNGILPARLIRALSPLLPSKPCSGNQMQSGDLLRSLELRKGIADPTLALLENTPTYRRGVFLWCFLLKPPGQGASLTGYFSNLGYTVFNIFHNFFFCKSKHLPAISAQEFVFSPVFQFLCRQTM